MCVCVRAFLSHGKSLRSKESKEENIGFCLFPFPPLSLSRAARSLAHSLALASTCLFSLSPPVSPCPSLSLSLPPLSVYLHLSLPYFRPYSSHSASSRPYLSLPTFATVPLYPYRYVLVSSPARRPFHSAPAALRVTRVLLGVGSRQVKTDRDGK